MLVIALCLVTFLFGSVRQIKLAVRQLLGARKYDVSYRIVRALLSLVAKS